MASTPARVVVVGGGLAGAKTVEALRAQGFTGSLTLVADESELPYERPPLSKDFLQGKAEFDSAVVHPQDWYREHDVDLRRGVAVMSIDRDAHTVSLADGDLLGYDKLVLATGAVPRRLEVPGGDAVANLRTRLQSEGLREHFGEGRRIVVIGAGWIGLEVAAAARQAGSSVVVLDSADQPLLGVLGPEIAQVFAELHRAHGVDLRLGVRITAVETGDDGAPTGVVVDGETVPADLVVAGVGVAPEDSLARLADLRVDDGILVDSALRTSDRDIFAVGDVANHDHPVLGYRVRVEHWANALNQPATAAAAILGDSAAAYDNLPYFYSDQFDLGMEYVGHLPRGRYDRVVVRGDLDKREFVAFWLDAEQHVLAAMNVNVWDVVDALKPIIAEKRVIDPERLADDSVPYAEL